MPVVRISKGRFAPADAEAAARLLAESERALRGALTELDGLIHYYVAIDREQGYLTNVSIWDSLAHAHQMDALQPMLAQRPILEAAGVSFEPITNHETLWTISRNEPALFSNASGLPGEQAPRRRSTRVSTRTSTRRPPERDRPSHRSCIGGEGAEPPALSPSARRRYAALYRQDARRGSKAGALRQPRTVAYRVGCLDAELLSEEGYWSEAERRRWRLTSPTRSVWTRLSAKRHCPSWRSKRS